MRKALLALLIPALMTATAVRAEPLVIKAGRLVDTEHGIVATRKQIVISDGIIESVVDADARVPADAKVIDLSQETVLPGLIDCHTHMLDECEADPIAELQKSAADKVLEAIPHAARTLKAGFTSVRDVGVFRAFTDVALRDAIARGDVVGPRMFVVGTYITIAGGGGSLTGLAPDVRLPEEMHFGEATGPWEVRRIIRQCANRHVDYIKIIATGSVLAHGINPGTPEFTLEELQAAVDEASKFGLRVAAHAHGTQGIKDAVRAGVASIEHGTYLDDEAIALMKQHGTYLVSDIYNDEYIREDGAKHGMPPDFVAHEAAVGQTQRNNFARAVKAGVKMAFGTDAGVYPHGQNARQFAWMVRYGMTSMQAIQSATINAADLLGKQSELGSISPGKHADIIAVRGDPLSDISVLENVDFVMKDGVRYF